MVDTDQEINNSICSHLYLKGFHSGLYSDLTLRVPLLKVEFKLHRIVCIQSKVLEKLCTVLNDPTVVLNSTDPNLTADGLAIALGHLYHFSNVNFNLDDKSQILTSVFAAAHLLQLHDLMHKVFLAIKQDVSLENIAFYCNFVSTDYYGNDSTHLRNFILAYLSKQIVLDSVERYGLVWGSHGQGYKELVSLFAKLPWDCIKNVLESPNFEITNDMERFFDLI